MNIVIQQSDKQVLATDTLKSHLRIDHKHEDAYLREIISMATDILEKNIEKPILKKTYKYIFHDDDQISSRKIPIPMSQVQAVLSVRRMLGEKKSEKVAYTFENQGEKTFVITNGSRHPVEIKYTAGITDNEAEIPKDLQFAVLQIAKNIYECSEEDVLESKYIKYIINANRTLHID